ncbi:hypothetical protein BKA70DRAFT_1444718 [Coprinopsis sp. MPI-PUGE-AT-0042]|nr:hypothetical protein BKA70DRAFT_1444718 [Coprinopsis sp. MPI-PUGE-AT-0042]
MTKDTQRRGRAAKPSENSFNVLASDNEVDPPATPSTDGSDDDSESATGGNDRPPSKSIAAYFPRMNKGDRPISPGPFSYAQAAAGAKRRNCEVEAQSVTSSPVKKKANTSATTQIDLDGDAAMQPATADNGSAQDKPDLAPSPTPAREGSTGTATQYKGKSADRERGASSNDNPTALLTTSLHPLDSFEISAPSTPQGNRAMDITPPPVSPLAGPEHTHSRPPTEYIKHYLPKSRWPPEIEGSTFDLNFPVARPGARDDTPEHAHCGPSSDCQPIPFNLPQPKVPHSAPNAPEVAQPPRKPSTTAFVDDEEDDDPFAAEEDQTAQSQGVNDPIITYYDGPLPDHHVSYIHILESLTPGIEEKWKKEPGHKLLAYFAKDRPYNQFLARIEEIKREIKRVTGSSAGVRVSQSTVDGSISQLNAADIIQPFLISGLTLNQKDKLAGKRQTNCSQSWIFWFPFDVPNPKFAFSIAHIPLRDDEEGRSTVVKDVRKAFNSEPIYGHLLDHIAKYSDRFPEDFPKDPARRVRAFIRSVTASALTIKVRGKREEMVWRIYFEPPHSDPVVHRDFIIGLKNFNYTIDDFDFKPYKIDFKCLSCRSRDHMQGLCPFRALPGFYDTRFGDDNNDGPGAPGSSSLVNIARKETRPREVAHAPPYGNAYPQANPHNRNLPPPLMGAYDPYWFNPGYRGSPHGGPRGGGGHRSGQGRNRGY